MDWNGNLKHFASSRPECSYGFLYNYNYDQFQGVDMKNHNQGMVSETISPQGLVNPAMEMKSGININNHGSTTSTNYSGFSGSTSLLLHHDKKKRLTSDQLDSLEKSFQEEIKLEPDRKMKLSRELGLQPRQIAVWFQNRRARWKAKQLERLYDSLKLEFDVMSKEKLKLQDEVMKLKAMLRDQGVWKQVSAGAYTEISGEETVESTSGAIRSSGKSQGITHKPHHHHHHHQQQTMVEHHSNQNNFNNNNNNNNDDQEYNHVSPPPYWGPIIPSYP